MVRLLGLARRAWFTFVRRNSFDYETEIKTQLCLSTERGYNLYTDKQTCIFTCAQKQSFRHRAHKSFTLFTRNQSTERGSKI